MKALLKYLNVQNLTDTIVHIVIGGIACFFIGIVLRVFWFIAKAGWNVWPDWL